MTQGFLLKRLEASRWPRVVLLIITVGDPWGGLVRETLKRRSSVRAMADGHGAESSVPTAACPGSGG